jgi:hypothetical protein
VNRHSKGWICTNVVSYELGPGSIAVNLLTGH